MRLYLYVAGTICFVLSLLGAALLLNTAARLGLTIAVVIEGVRVIAESPGIVAVVFLLSIPGFLRSV